jgi:hypothetical protein
VAERRSGWAALLRRCARVSLLLVAMTTLAACAAATASRAARDIHPGVWQSRDHGYVLAVDGGRVRMFEVAGALCVQKKDLEESILPFVDQVRLEADGATMVLASVVEPYENRLTRIAALPAACTPQATSTPRGRR